MASDPGKKENLNITHMKNRFNAVPWSYVEDRDPEVLKNYNGFGTSLFVVRHQGTVNQYFKEIFKEVITNDPGLNIFKVYYCMGTGDVYYLGSIESGNIRYWQALKSKLQHEMDTLKSTKIKRLSTSRTKLSLHLRQ
jgi:hypothetical protein